MNEVAFEVAILGGGNGGVAMLADLTRRGFTPRLWDFPRFAQSLNPIRARGVVELIGEVEALVPLQEHQFADDLVELLRRATVVLVSMPAYAHRRMAETVAPHLRKGQILVLSPSTGGALEVAQILRSQRAANVVLAEFQSLPYACRRTGPCQINLVRTKQRLPVAALPATRTPEVVERLRVLYPSVTPALNVLEIGLNNMNPMVHPAPMLLNVSIVEKCRGKQSHFGDCITPAVGRVIERLDRERMDLMAALRIPPYSLLNFMRDAYHIEGEDIVEVLSTSLVHTRTGGPDSLVHRYVSEDIPYGLVPMCEIADRVGQPMPVSRQLVNLACLLTDHDWWREGRSLAAMGLDQARDADDLHRLVTSG